MEHPTSCSSWRLQALHSGLHPSTGLAGTQHPAAVLPPGPAFFKGPGGGPPKQQVTARQQYVSVRTCSCSCWHCPCRRCCSWEPACSLCSRACSFSLRASWRQATCRAEMGAWAEVGAFDCKPPGGGQPA